MATRGNGKGIRFIRDHVNYQGDDCVLWPMFSEGGYGHLGYLGVHNYAHRLMCELAHGPAPSKSHEAAHECGNGLCVNPRHLSWKTHSENQLDRRKHGTQSNGPAGKLSFQDAEAIRALRGLETYEKIAARYGVHRSTITHVMRRTHFNKEPKGYRHEGNKFYACIIIKRKCIRLGSFDNPEEAKAAYRVAKERVRVGLSPKALATD
jgi:hypothetical protein